MNGYDYNPPGLHEIWPNPPEPPPFDPMRATPATAPMRAMREAAADILDLLAQCHVREAQVIAREFCGHDARLIAELQSMVRVARGDFRSGVDRRVANATRTPERRASNRRGA